MITYKTSYASSEDTAKSDKSSLGTVLLGAVWSGSTLFALTYLFEKWGTLR